MTELLSCPFCGGPAQSNGIAPGVFISCKVCGTNQNGVFPSEAEAITAWNTRHPSRNDVLEEAARVADQEQLRAKAEVETYETGCAYRTAALAEMGLAARFAQSIRALKDRDG